MSDLDIQPGDPAVLPSLLQLYVYDLSELVGIDVEADGRYRTPDCSDGQLFFARVDGKLAGFALVRQRSRLTGAEGVNDVAEFFVLRRYRRQKIGERLATWLFDRFAGRWEVRQRTANQAATAFWRRVISDYTKGRFEEQLLDDPRWRGPVQRFTCCESPGRQTPST